MGACFVCPETGTKAVVTRFGRFSHVVEPGCHVLNPLMCNVVAGTVSLRVRESRHAIDVKTKDNVFLSLSVAIQYEVIPDKVYEAFYKLQNPQSQMEAYVVDVVRAHIPRLSLDMVFVEKENLSQQIRGELGEAMASYGYLILKTLITDIDPSGEVKQAMNEIVKQQRLKMAAEFKGEATRILAVKTAQAEGEKIRIQAAADAEAKFLNGQGIARQRAAIINGMRDDVSNFSSTVDNVGAREVLHLIVLTQYLDTLRDVASKTKSNSMFVPHGPGSVSALSEQIRNGFLHASDAPS